MKQECSYSFDICIVGAGIAGSAMASYLASKGYSVALVERDWNKAEDIVGELLQPGGVKKLIELGLEHTLEGIEAQPIRGYALFLNEQLQQLQYPLTNEAINPTGFGFKYARFVGKLRQMARENKNITCFEGSVLHLMENDTKQISGVIFKNKEKEDVELTARLTIVSQGSLSTLRSSLSQAKTDIKGYMLGMELIEAELPFEGHGHVIMANPAPILVYPIGHKKARILIDFPREEKVVRGEELKKYLVEHIKPQLPEILQHPFENAVFEGNFKAKPTCLLASRPVLKDGAVLLGDSLNMRHPTTGGGMTVALTDVYNLGNRLVSVGDLSNFKALRKAIGQFYRERHKHNASINILAYALYSVMKHDKLRRACFDYLKKGGNFAAGPMSILSGVSRSRWVLLRHFFYVAGLAVLSQKRTGIFHSLKNTIGLLNDATGIIFPLIRDELPKIYK